MADIRGSALLDDFQRADEPTVLPPWYLSPGSVNVAITSGSLGGTLFPTASALAYYSAASFYGPSVETWGKAGGNPGLGGGWRYGMYTVESLVRGTTQGYQALPSNQVGGDTWFLRRIDDDNFTGLGSVSSAIPNAGQYCLMKRNGNDIECWMSTTSDPNGAWTLKLSVTDTTYMFGPWWFVYGTTGKENGWVSIGGGVSNFTQIIRWLSN